MSPADDDEAWQLSDVWGWNFDAEFEGMLATIATAEKASSSSSRPVVLGLDTEFPGVLCQGTPGDPESQYHALRENVDSMEPIQVGLAVADPNGTVVGTWAFNLWFDLSVQRYNKGSIDFLSGAGVDFSRHATEGIDPRALAWRLNAALLGPLSRCSWVTFSGRYDWGYLIKLVTGRPLPPDEERFDCMLDKFCASRQDLRDLLPVGSLGVLAKLHNVDRCGASHTAGSDAVTTLSLFLKVTRSYSTSVVDSVVLSGEKETVVAKIGVASPAEESDSSHQSAGAAGATAGADAGAKAGAGSAAGAAATAAPESLPVESGAGAEGEAAATAAAAATGAAETPAKSIVAPARDVAPPAPSPPMSTSEPTLKTSSFAKPSPSPSPSPPLPKLSKEKERALATAAQDAATAAAARAAAATARANAGAGSASRSLGSGARMKYLLADASKDRCSVCKYTLGPDEIICGMCGATRPPGSEPLQIPADRDSPWSEILNYPQARVIHEDRCRDCGHAFKRPEALLCRMCGTPRPEKLVYPKARSVVQDRCRECNHPFKRPDFMQCRMCGTPRIEKKDPPKVRGDVPQDRCRECNYKFMRPEVLTCRMCGTRRPEPEALKVSESPPRGESAEPAEQASSPRAAKEAKASVSKVEPAVLPRDEKQTLQQAQSRSVPSKMLSAKEWLSVPRRRCRADVSVSRLQELAIFASILCVSEIVFAAIIRSQTGGPVG